MDQAADEVVASILANQQRNRTQLGPGGRIPVEYDRELLSNGSDKLDGRRLERGEVTYIRNSFREKITAGSEVH